MGSVSGQRRFHGSLEVRDPDGPLRTRFSGRFGGLFALATVLHRRREGNLRGPPVPTNMEGRAPIMCLVGNDRPLHAAGLARRSVLEQIGGWDETLRFWECEEVTFRLAKAGRLHCAPSPSPLYFWRQHRDKPYLGDARARYHTRPVALSWIDQILKGLEYKSFDESALSVRDRQDVLNYSSQWARQLFRIDRTAFREYLAKARKLDPNLAPAYPAVISVIARHVGYEAAEAIVELGRIPRDFLRKLLHGKQAPHGSGRD